MYWIDFSFVPRAFYFSLSVHYQLPFLFPSSYSTINSHIRGQGDPMLSKKVLGEAFCYGAILALSAGQMKTYFWSLEPFSVSFFVFITYIY